MATKPILIRRVGLFLPALLMTVLGTLQEIPDDKVYTELQKTLIDGTWGILTCRFTGPPYAVYWKKGHDPWTSPTLMTWTPDGKTGPRYEDGTCDMDENYSLIIKAVSYTDAGRYICMVSNQHGVLIDNYTDVTVTNIALETEPTVSTQMSETGVLPCHVNIRPKKVSWIRSPDTALVTMDLDWNVIERSGPGYEKGLFNMTKEYSLVINDVTIQHEGRYLCEVIDFDTDKVYRNVTMLTVFAKPTDAFPVIQECPMADQSNCIITTDSSVILTCYVNQYYPDINLVFMHGSELVEFLTILTWNNTDGTKNKNVTISADISHDVYKCIASGIPGFDLIDEKFSSVRLIQHVHEQNNSILAVLIVPIVICLTVILLAWLRLRKRSTGSSTPRRSAHMDIQDMGTQSSSAPESAHMDIQDEKSNETVDNGNRLSKEERYMEDHVTYVELWTLVEFIIEDHETRKLDDEILVRLLQGYDGDERSQDDKDQEYYYQQLCRWKETCDQTINQMNTLFDKCRQVRLHECVRKVEEYRRDISKEIPLFDLEHILWQIGEPFKIAKFLQSLGLDTKGETELPSKKKIIEVAMGKLSKWKPSTPHFNRAVVLSSMMEMLDYCTSSNNFFQIPAEKKDVFIDDELERFVRDLTAITTNHWDKLKSIIESSNRSIKPNDLHDNNTVLFDIKKMLLDWWEYVECSNYDKRRILESISRGIFDVTESPANNHWPSDDELELIAAYVKSPTIESVCNKLNVKSLPEDADERQRFEALCQWRTSSNDQEWPMLYGKMRSALEDVGVSGLLPPLRNDPIHKAEYVDIAFDLLMCDILPVAKALGVIVTKLPACRPVFEPSHFEIGTIGLIAHFIESAKKGDSRLVLYNRLIEAGFPMAVAKNILVNHIAYGELFTISNAMTEGDCRHGDHGISSGEEKAPGENESLLKGFDVATAEMNISIGEEKGEEKLRIGHFTKIKKMLQLTDEELAICSPTSESLDEFAMFRMWKEKPHLDAFNERADIIQGLLDIGRPDIARSVAEGYFYGRELNLDVIKCIVKKMDENEVGLFENAFDLQEEFQKSTLSDDVTSAIIIYDFLRKGERKIKQAKDLKILIDKLVDNGFLNLALELISIHN